MFWSRDLNTPTLKGSRISRVAHHVRYYNWCYILPRVFFQVYLDRNLIFLKLLFSAINPLIYIFLGQDFRRRWAGCKSKIRAKLRKWQSRHMQHNDRHNHVRFPEVYKFPVSYYDTAFYHFLSDFCVKIGIFLKNRTLFCQKSAFLSNVGIFAKNRNCCQNLEYFVRHLNVYHKIEIYMKNQIFCQYSTFDKNRKFSQ